MRSILSWLGKHEVSVLLAVAAVAFGILVFAEIADQVIDGGTQGIDRRILLAVRTPASLPSSETESIDSAARDITALGGVLDLTLITVFVAGFLTLDGRGSMAGFVCGAVFSGMVLSTLLKDVFHRPRPELVPHLQYVTNSSFPSGHSMMSAVTYLTLGALLARSQRRRSLRAFFLLGAVFLTMLIGISRVFLGVHWPTDVLAGWVAGSIWAIVCWLVARRLQSHHSLEPAHVHTSPSQG